MIDESGVIILGHNNDENDEEYDEHEKDLDHEPPIGSHRLKVLEEFGMRLADVQIDVLDIRVDALNRLVLFLDHSSELLKHTS